jgi:hypothetical protein
LICLGAQMPARVTSLHQLPEPHCASLLHTVEQAPLAIVQNGAPTGHGVLAPLPELPLQGAHT